MLANPGSVVLMDTQSWVLFKAGKVPKPPFKPLDRKNVLAVGQVIPGILPGEDVDADGNVIDRKAANDNDEPA